MKFSYYKEYLVLAGLAICSSGFAQQAQPDYSKLISGRFILKGAECAGYDFVNSSFVTWTNELFCNSPDTFRIRWMDNSTFIVKEFKRGNKDCPPLIYIERVESYDGTHLVLKEFDTSWGNGKNEKSTYIKAGK